MLLTVNLRSSLSFASSSFHSETPHQYHFFLSTSNIYLPQNIPFKPSLFNSFTIMKFTMTAVLAAALLSTSASAVVLPRGGGEGGDPPKNFTPITPATTARVATELYKPPFAAKASERAEKEIICDEGGCHTRGVPQNFPPIAKPTKTASVATEPYVPPFATKVPRAKGDIICDEGGCQTVGVPRSFPPIPQASETARVGGPFVPPRATKVARAKGDIICDEGGCHTEGVPQVFPTLPHFSTAILVPKPTKNKRSDEASVTNSAQPPIPTEFIEEKREEGGDPPKHFTPINPVTTTRQGGPYVPPNKVGN